MVWEGSVDSLKEFMFRLNQNTFNLKFFPSFSNEVVTFLDMKVLINENKTLKTTLFRKPTTENKTLRYQSFHSKA